MCCLKNLVFDSFLVRILVAMFILRICVPIDFKGHKLSSIMWFKTTTAADNGRHTTRRCSRVGANGITPRAPDHTRGRLGYPEGAKLVREERSDAW